MRFKALTALLVFAALAGCANGPRPLTGGNLAVLPMTELPPPTPALAQTAERPYLIGPFDKIEVDVFGVAEMFEAGAAVVLQVVTGVPRAPDDPPAA